MSNTPPITRDDIIKGFRELEGEVDERKDDALSLAMSIGIAVAVGVVVTAYIFGRRVGRRRSTVVEIRRM